MDQFRVFCESVPRQILFIRASCSSWSSNGHTSTTVWQKIRSVPHFLQPPAIDKEARVKRKNVCKSKAWRDGANLKAHCVTIISARNTGTWAFFSNAVFNHFPLEDLSQTNGNRLVGAPRAHFPSKTQNRQIARTSPFRPDKFFSLFLVMRPHWFSPIRRKKKKKKVLFLIFCVESQHKVCMPGPAPVPSTVPSTRSRTRWSMAFEVKSGKG